MMDVGGPKHNYKALVLGVGLAAVLAGGLMVGVVADRAAAAFPGKNGRIAFESDRSGNLEIYTMNSNGTGLTQLTNNSASDLYADWGVRVK